MTDFWTEGDKDAIKTKPSYPGCCCKQQVSPHNPAPSRFISQEVEGIQVPLEELGLPTSIGRWEHGSNGGTPGNEKKLDFPSSPRPSIMRQHDLEELLLTFFNGLDILAEGDCYCDARPWDRFREAA